MQKIKIDKWISKKIVGSILVVVGMFFCVILSVVLLRREYIQSFNDLEYNTIEDRLESDIRYIEDLIGKGEWEVIDGILYRGTIALGDSTIENANEAPFLEHMQKTGTLSYVFLRTDNDSELIWVGDEETGYQQGHYVRVAGSTKNPKGEQIEGTYIQKAVADALDLYGEYNGISNVTGGMIYCRYETLKNSAGEVIGAIVVGRNITELQAVTAEYVDAMVKRTFFIIIFSLILAISYVSILMRSKIIKNHAIEEERIRNLSELIDEHMFQYDFRKDVLEFNDNNQSFSSEQVVKGYLEKTLKENMDESTLESTLVPSITQRQNNVREISLKKIDNVSCMYRIITKIIFDENGREQYAIGKIINIQKEFEKQAVLLDRAMRDGMTQLYNQSGFKTKVEENIQYDGMFCMIDVDSFKEINDTYGHSCGDQVLCNVGAALRNVLGPETIVGRMGGDEFAAYIPIQVDVSVLENTCDELLSVVGQIGEVLHMKEPVTLSIGICYSRSGESYNSIYERADKVLYVKKKNGKNGYQIEV